LTPEQIKLLQTQDLRWAFPRAPMGYSHEKSNFVRPTENLSADKNWSSSIFDIRQKFVVH
jgi:hypothetical protein